VAVDSLGHANIFYYDEAARDLRLARHNPNIQDWILELIDEDGDVGSQSSTIYDPARHVVEVAYYDRTNGDLKLAQHRPAGDPPGPGSASLIFRGSGREVGRARPPRGD
jgi:hypothetical protein